MPSPINDLSDTPVAGWFHLSEGEAVSEKLINTVHLIGEYSDSLWQGAKP